MASAVPQSLERRRRPARPPMARHLGQEVRPPTSAPSATRGPIRASVASRCTSPRTRATAPSRAGRSNANGRGRSSRQAGRAGACRPHAHDHQGADPEAVMSDRGRPLLSRPPAGRYRASSQIL